MGIPQGSRGARFGGRRLRKADGTLPQTRPRRAYWSKADWAAVHAVVKYLRKRQAFERAARAALRDAA